MFNVYLMILVATVANIATVYFMKLSVGMTIPWPTLGMLVANLLTNWFLGRALASGANVGGAVTMLVVGVMMGSFVVGLAFGERITGFQAVGAAIAVAGVIVCNMSAAHAV
jgi:small multidrug resistance pump